MGRIMERIPHTTVAYAYLEIEAENSNAFEALREEALKNRPNYGFALGQPAEPKVVEAADEPAAPVVTRQPAAPPADAAAEEGRGVADLPPEAAVSTPTLEVQATEADAAPTKASVTPEEGLSPREKARLRAAAQKGAA